ncbi:MAG: hypothetical protein HY553_01465 [Elusimicrobia bacterium]|nr:hypothetical protein [Elusimicrobiota bacterium]
MRRSERGRVISDFLIGKGIPIRIDPDRFWVRGAGAAYDWSARAILVPPEAKDRDAVSLAISIAHEGYHALQAIELEMIPCIEAEQDAAFAGFAVYFEMLENGALPLKGEDALDFEFFAESIKHDRLRRFDLLVQEVHEKRRESILGLGNFLPLLGRLVFGVSLRISDFAWNLTEDYQILDDHRWHLSYWWNKEPVKRTRRAHQEDEERKEQWIKEHRQDFQRHF